MVQPEFEYGRRMSAVFCGSHHNDHVGGPGFVSCALAADPYRQSNKIPQRKHHQDQRRQTGCALDVRYSYVNIVCAARVASVFSQTHMARTEQITSAANPLLKDVRRAIARGGLTDEDGASPKASTCSKKPCAAKETSA